MIDLGDSSEDDVLEAFNSGLRAFIRHLNGSFESVRVSAGARRVTLPQERKYPSDRDFAILFEGQMSVSVHFFGLQFKKWDKRRWEIDNKQLENIHTMAHVIA